MQNIEADRSLRTDQAEIVRLAAVKLDVLGARRGDMQPGGDEPDGNSSAPRGLQRRYEQLSRFVTAHSVPVEAGEAVEPTEEELAEQAKAARTAAIERVKPPTMANVDRTIAYIVEAGGEVEADEAGTSPASQIREDLGMSNEDWNLVRLAGAKTGVITVNKYEPEAKKGGKLKSVTVDLDIAEKFAGDGRLSKGTVKAIRALRRKREEEPEELQAGQAGEGQQPDDAESPAPKTFREKMLVEIRAQHGVSNNEETRRREEVKEAIRIRLVVDGERLSIKTTLRLLDDLDEDTYALLMLETSRQMEGEDAPETDEERRKFVLEKMNAGRDNSQYIDGEGLDFIIENALARGELSMNGSGFPALTGQGLERIKEANIRAGTPRW